MFFGAKCVPTPLRRLISVACLAAGLVVTAAAQVPTVSNNPQHTGIFSGPVQKMNRIKWNKIIDDSATGDYIHYGQPLVTAANTIIVPVRIAFGTFEVRAYDASTGNLKYTLPSDFTYFNLQNNWPYPFQPVLTKGPSNQLRMYYPGAGGTVYYIDNPDSNSPGSATRIPFYTDLASYTANKSAYDSTLYVQSPITADSQGNIYFCVRNTSATPPAPFTDSQSPFARISVNGVGSWVTAAAAANVSTGTVNRFPSGMAPALSNDEQTVYFCAAAPDAYLIGVNASNLAPKYAVAMRDPRNGNIVSISGSSTASPLVGPDGDVYYGVFGNPFNGSRGFLMHYNSSLTVTKIPGGFGWDNTPGVVPASMVPSYKGPSSYLLFCKYNNYTFSGSDGNGVNMMAILDPNVAQTDPHVTAPGLQEMREVLSIIGNTPDDEHITGSTPNAVREWCVNNVAVHPATNSVYFNSEDGHATRWDLSTNSMAEALELNAGIGQPYVPTIIGPDGTSYTLNGGNLFAMGDGDGVRVTINSNKPDNQANLAGDSITFTANVSSTTTGTPTGTVTFTARTFQVNVGGAPQVQFIDSTLASNVPLVGGTASTTTSSLTAGGGFNGCYYITASYSGDGNFPAASSTRVQKVHANASTTTLQTSGSPVTYGTNVTLTATVAGVPGGSGTPSGMVFFREGNTALGQVPVDPATSQAVLVTNKILPGTRTITAEYYGDFQFAKSNGTVSQVVQGMTSLALAPPSLRGGLTSVGTVTLAGAAPAGGAVINLTSNKSNAVVPSTVTVAAGATSANFNITTNNTSSVNVVAQISASLGTVLNQNLTVEPGDFTSFVSQTIPNAMIAGQTYQAVVQYQNTGSTTWTAAANYKLQSRNPTNNTTFGINRLGLTNGPVAPGQTGIFKGNLIAPTTAGSYTTQWLPILEGIHNFGATSPAVTVTVTTAADAAQFVSQTVPATLNTGASFSPTIVFKNVGTATWSSGAGYRLVSRNPFNNTTWGTNSIALTSAVAPGGTMTITPTLTAPTTPGTYQFQWSLIHGGTLFGDLPPSKSVQVAVAPDNAQFVSQSVPTSVGPGTTFSATMTFKNTGTNTWTSAAAYVLRSQNPAGNTTFGTSQLNLPATTAPNANATFTQNFTAPTTPGTYQFQWRMHHSVGFGDFSPSVTITVTADAAVFVSKTGPVQIDAGKDFYVQNTMKNTGTTSWSTGTGYAMMSQTPANNTTWGRNRIFLPGAGSVAPGATVTLTGLCTAPITPGTYAMQWQMSKSSTGFGQLTPLINIVVVQGANNAQYVSVTGLTHTMVHGTTFNATIVMKNLGTATWTSASGYALQSMNPAGNTNWGVSSIPVTGSVAPNANATFTQTFTAPATPGTYQFQWRMGQSGTAFGEYTLNLTINVT